MLSLDDVLSDGRVSNASIFFLIPAKVFKSDKTNQEPGESDGSGEMCESGKRCKNVADKVSRVLPREERWEQSQLVRFNYIPCNVSFVCKFCKYSIVYFATNVSRRQYHCNAFLTSPSYFVKIQFTNIWLNWSNKYLGKRRAEKRSTR